MNNDGKTEGDKKAEKARRDHEFNIAWRRGRAAQLLEEANALERGGHQEGGCIYRKDGTRVE